MATESVKRSTTITAALKKQAIVLNKEVFQATSELLDNSVKTAEKWQGLTEKAIKIGTKMFATQQDVVLTTLEATVGQFKATQKRFNKLVGTKTKKVKPSADEQIEGGTNIESDLTIDEVMEATVAKPKKQLKIKN